MIDMDIELLTCGYSFHMERFYMSHKGGLPSFLFRLQTEGSCEAMVEGAMKPIAAGDLLLYKPGDSYELLVEKPSDHPEAKIASGDYFLFCRGAWIEAWWSRSHKPTCSRIGLDEKLLSLWRQLILEKLRMEDADPELMGYLLQALCLNLERAASETVSLQGIPFTGTRMKRYIEAHASMTFKLEEVAGHVGLSVSRAVHLFKEYFGKTMIEYAQEVRLSSALERMQYSAMNLEQIAESCGFGSYPYFHRVFKAKHGISPNDYRKKFARQ
jgi:AraC family transcriptional regulator of arabinose operon